MKLRHRLRQSPVLVGLVARLAYGWLRLCNRTTRWQIFGRDSLDAALSEGPVIVVLWHEHLMTALLHWRGTGKPLMSLHDTSPIGRVAGAMEALAGLIPVAMSAKASNLAMSRRIRRAVQDGVSVGLTGDGPEGPRREMKTAPLDWARATGVPVFLYASAMRRQRRLDTWDRMILPLPFTRGVAVFERWDVSLPRRGAPDELDALRQKLEAAVSAQVARVERALTERT